jgi:opacity protein-like surface antigen
MKRVFIVSIVLISTILLAHAQFNTHSKLIGASSSLDFGLFSQKDDVTDEKVSIYNFELTPKAAYFIQNRIALGGEIHLSTSSSKPEGSDAIKSSSWLIGPFGRYYYKTVSGFVPFGEAGLGFGREVDKMTDFSGSPYTITHNIFYWRLGVGASVFLADNFSLEPMLAFRWEKAKNPEGGGSHTTQGIMFGLGFVFYFDSLERGGGSRSDGLR